MKLPKLLFIAAVTIQLLLAGSVAAQSPSSTNNWLQFRGPNGTGVAEGPTLPAEFGAKKNLVWKTPVPFARSSPVVTADRVFLTASEGDKLDHARSGSQNRKGLVATRRCPRAPHANLQGQRRCLTNSGERREERHSSFLPI